MPDPLTHVCLAWLVGRAGRLRRALPVFLIGTVLPDVLSAGPAVLFGSYWYWAAAHTPVGVLVWAYAAALLFQEADRRTAFAALVAGGWLAIGLDTLQHHLSGGYMLLFPFWWGEYELGLFSTEASLDWLPYLLGVVVLVEAALAIRARLARPA